jgi:hypothetical protein
MASFDEVRALKRRHSADLLKRPGVCGLDIETTGSGDSVLTVHLDTDDPDVRGGLPDQLDGFPLRYLYTGPFRKQ